jgi:hypothetical protein
MVGSQLTYFPLFDLPCREANDDKYLGHHLYDYFHHSCGPRESDIHIQPSEEVFDALKEGNNFILGCANGLNRLRTSASDQCTKQYK